jgi:N-methylhydantoinase A
VVTLRVTALGNLPKPAFTSQPAEGTDASAAAISSRAVYFDTGFHESTFYDRTRLRPGNEVTGPAIVVQDDATTVIGLGQALRVDGYGNLIVQTGA